MEMNEELLSILKGFRYAERINPIIRITYFGYSDNQIMSDDTFDSIEEAEEWLGIRYCEEGFSDEDGEVRVYLNGIEKSFTLCAKIDV